jgi:hypothetical protein
VDGIELIRGILQHRTGQCQKLCNDAWSLLRSTVLEEIPGRACILRVSLFHDRMLPTSKDDLSAGLMVLKYAALVLSCA